MEMDFNRDFRNPRHVHSLTDAIRQAVKHEWHIMEICGGQTHAIARYRLEKMLPPQIHLIHGPGCPVCVTPAATIDAALQLASRPDIIFVSFGDMLRVPGSGSDDLLSIKARGGDVRMVYSPLDALKIADQHPEKEVVFFAIGFETTAPVHAMTLLEAHRRQIKNFSMLTALVTVPAAIDALVSDPANRIDGLLAAGHVCAVTGYNEYEQLATRLKLPVTVTGFEPLDLLYGIYRCVLQLEQQDYTVKNAYTRVASAGGNLRAQQVMESVFEPADQEWRGLGQIKESGYQIRKKYELFDAKKRFHLKIYGNKSVSPCEAGNIMRGRISPAQCPEFGCTCTPEHPLGAPMVSSEGACAAFYKYS